MQRAGGIFSAAVETGHAAVDAAGPRLRAHSRAEFAERGIEQRRLHRAELRGTEARHVAACAFAAGGVDQQPARGGAAGIQAQAES